MAMFDENLSRDSMIELAPSPLRERAGERVEINIFSLSLDGRGPG